MSDYSAVRMGSTADDYALALQLQEEFDKENSMSIDVDDLPKYDLSPVYTPEFRNISNPASPKRSLSVTDNLWELVDPSPDARALFVEFNDKYFWNKLNGVEVRWSPRMTLYVFQAL